MATNEERDDYVRMIRDSAGAVVPKDGDLARVRACRFVEPGFSRDVWRELCEMGWLGLKVPEAEGGSGLGLYEFCALAEELGRGLVPEPLIEAAAALGFLDGDLKQAVLAGDRIVLPAVAESAGELGAGRNTTLQAGRLEGRKVFIPQAGGADAFVVATADGAAIIAADAEGLALTLQARQDGGYFGTLQLSAVEATATASGEFAAAFDEQALSTAAYLLGVMDRALEITLDYLKVREQFGRPIGSFQALQHRAADVKIQVELTRASVTTAALAIDAGCDARTRSLRVSQAKARAAQASMLVAREAVQMHGAIGYTDESDIGLYVRKIMSLVNVHGSATAHRHRFGALFHAAEPQHGQHAR